MDINIIDRNFNLLGRIDGYESYMPNKKWHGIGNVKFHLNENALHAEKLEKENIIYTSENKAYIILYREFDSKTGNLIIQGREIKSYFSRWLIFPPSDYPYYRINDNVETIIKEYVQATLDRKGVTNIIVAPNLNRGDITVHQAAYNNLAEEIEKLSLTTGLGWDLTLDIDNKQLIFDVYEGLNRTAEQDINPRAIFAIENDNIVEQKLIDSKLNYANTAIVGGKGYGENRIIEVVGDLDKGLDSYEIFVDANNIEYDEDLPTRGEQELMNTQEILNFDSQVDTTKNLEYELDFNLGDLVTTKNNRWNIIANQRITEITEIYERSGFRLDVQFGESVPTLIDKIRQVIN